MLISKEGDIEDPIRRRLVSALHRFGVDVVEMRVPGGGLDAVEFNRCCNIAREEGVNIILAYGEGTAIEYARAVATSTWSAADSWRQYSRRMGGQLHKHIPFGHVFASLEQYNTWSQAFGGTPPSSIEPDFAIQVTSAIY